MAFSDLNFIIQWWFVLFLVGVVFLPLTTTIFSSFFDRGYIFAKVLGIIIVSYAVFLLGILKVLPFTISTILLVIGIFTVINFMILKKYYRSTIEQPFDSAQGGLNNGTIKIVAFEELLFFIALLFWSYIRAHQPDIHGLEKYMDFGFINSILRSEYFPPKDMWFTPFSINYYYFGHLYTAVLTKLSGIPSSITYNLIMATLFSLTFTGAFSIGANLVSSLKPKARGDTTGRAPDSAQPANWRGALAGGKVGAGPRTILAGFLTAFLVTLAGNLHAIYSFFKPYINENPLPFWQLAFSPETFPNSYWYPNATRFIYNTIHEFPIYSFVVSDLHGHVLSIPIVLTIIAVLFSVISKSQILNSKQIANSNSEKSKNFGILNFGHWGLFRNSKLEISEAWPFGLRNLLLISFLLAVMYMTNAWDGIIYFLLASLTLLFLKFKNSLKIENFKFQIYHWIGHLFILGLGFLIFTLPFSLNFKPFVSGIGVLCAPEFLTKIGSFGPFIFEPDHCQRSPLWQLLILYGFFYFWVIYFIAYLIQKVIQNSKLKIKNYNSKFKIFNFKLHLFTFNFSFLTKSDIFALVLIALSTLLIFLPELIYVKDIYPAHYRANTMFKLGYQAFIMLSIASSYIIIRIVLGIKYYVSSINLEKKILTICYLLFATFLLILVFIYSYFAINSYYGNLQTYYGLDGTKYLANSYPTDYAAIVWLNKNIKGQPVVLEAQGDSYTDFARVSSNTGLPTVLGWTVHEWLWRGSYNVPAPRIEEVNNLYESKDITLTQKLLEKYNIELVFIGDLERQKYLNLNEQKFQQLGKSLYKNGNTAIYRIAEL